MTNIKINSHPHHLLNKLLKTCFLKFISFIKNIYHDNKTVKSYIVYDIYPKYTNYKVTNFFNCVIKHNTMNINSKLWNLIYKLLNIYNL